MKRELLSMIKVIISLFNEANMKVDSTVVQVLNLAR